MAIDGSKSSFKPDENNNYTLDTFKEMFELSASDAVNAQRWKQLKAISDIDKTESEQQEFQELTTKLSSKIVSADDWNLLLHAMYNLEQAYLNKGLDKIQETLKEYVQENASADVQEELNTVINNYLFTNATRVIISETQPDVIEGALWIKPKTT